MKDIKFADFYTKLRPFRLEIFGEGYVDVQLIGVFQVMPCELDECFWEYDADGIDNVRRFGYTDNGDKKLILLIFRHDNKIFTTVRPHRWQTYAYYREQVGNKFRIVMT